MRALLGRLLVALALSGCASSDWDGRVVSWGSMREVMREGRTEGRVVLAAAAQPASVGLGALAGLRGEIVVVRGETWVARVVDGRLECGRGALPEEQATLLALSEVSAWNELHLERDLTYEELVELLAGLAAEGRVAPDPWPFIIEGELFALEAHVLNGACPFAGEVPAGCEPLRRSLAHTSGMLVGFYAPRAAGQLVHHGEAIHAHVVLTTPEPYVGHVDHAAIAAGARVSWPR